MCLPAYHTPMLKGINFPYSWWVPLSYRVLLLQGVGCGPACACVAPGRPPDPPSRVRKDASRMGRPKHGPKAACPFVFIVQEDSRGRSHESHLFVVYRASKYSRSYIKNSTYPRSGNK